MDTIVAISTALGEGGIAICRLSGPEALALLNRHFRRPTRKPVTEKDHRLFCYGHMYRGEELLDEVLAVYFRAPHSYTREDMVEVHCHGGMHAITGVVETLLASGARLAEPGEFTKRAFLNGRLDLAQAEAVIDVISAKTQEGLRLGLDQLQGHLTEEVLALREDMLSLFAYIQADIDYPEEDIQRMGEEEMLRIVGEIKGKLLHLEESFSRGKLLQDGIYTVIVGKPNVGKSSLLNALLRENRAIVTDIPGTTRDTIEAYCRIHGLTLRLWDTAGMRETGDVVEQLGVERAKEAAEAADLLLAVFDRSRQLTAEDREILALAQGKRTIILWNKTDCEPAQWSEADLEIMRSFPVVETVLLESNGVEPLEKAILDLFALEEGPAKESVTITNVRHRQKLTEALDAVKALEEGLTMGITLDCLEVDLRLGYDALGAILGQAVGDDVLEAVFSRFCLGK